MNNKFGKKTYGEGHSGGGYAKAGKPAYGKKNYGNGGEKESYSKNGKASYGKKAYVEGNEKGGYANIGKSSYGKKSEYGGKGKFGGDFKNKVDKASGFEYANDGFENKRAGRFDDKRGNGLKNNDKNYAINKENVNEEENLHENMLEGRNPIREALKAGRNIERLLVAQGEIQGTVREIVYEANKNGAIIQEVERTRLDKLSVTGSHQGIIAFVAMKDYCSVDDILAYAKERNENPFIIILDGICDPQNLGAIIRSAECAGAHGVIIPERRAVGLTPVVAKCSAGAIEYMHIARVTNISQTIEKLKKDNVWVYGASMEGKSYAKMNMKGAVALVIGAEGDGLSQLVKRNCDCLVSLPQYGHIDSLNASVAAGVLMFEVVRQKNI